MGGPNPYMRKKKQRCWEFDAKGYCSRGLTCKFDHSVDLSAMQPPYVPSNADTDDGTLLLSSFFRNLRQTVPNIFQAMTLVIPLSFCMPHRSPCRHL